jgi:hypothetical protein
MDSSHDFPSIRVTSFVTSLHFFASNRPSKGLPNKFFQKFWQLNTVPDKEEKKVESVHPHLGIMIVLRPSPADAGKPHLQNEERTGTVPAPAVAAADAAFCSNTP